MNRQEASNLNIGVVGGTALAKEFIEKTALEYNKEGVDARIIAVADPDPYAPAMLLARDLHLTTVSDYHKLYDSVYNLHLMIILLPDENILLDIIDTKPPDIRVLSFPVFRFLWEAIRVEEKRLKERSEEMETILNGIQDSIVVITPEKEIVEVNDAFQKQMGYTREEIIGQKCHEVFQRTNRQCNTDDIVCPLNEAIRNKRPSQQVLTRLDHNDEHRFIEVSIFPIWEKDGKILRFIEISRDITDRKKEEEKTTRRLEQMVEERTQQLKKSHAILLHQDKMASLGKLSASVVHEINNPIAGILNLTLLIKRIVGEGGCDRKQNDQFLQYLNLMEMETRRVSRIVSNLLVFSRESQMEMNPLNLNLLIDKVLSLNANLLKIHGVKIQKVFDPSIPDIVGSEDQLQQVFMNILSNAVEAMETTDGCLVTILTGASQKDNHVTVRFEDQGIGIPEENLPKLFEPFFTTKRKGKGVGLGLSLVYGIIEEHHGSIKVDSQMGGGAAFIIELPITQPSDGISQQGG
ncbi:MAG: ATP-binding protein [Desulfatiglans sp.]|jgi:PAS domain S-box-containing protein|nr:ATP-binding protein [Desulfatiglans sp.]